MNKKFFTLLVAFLATVCMGAQALTFGVSAKYENGKNYLLSADGQNFIVLNATGNLEIVDGTTINDYASLQSALWTVSQTKASGSVAPTVEFTNVARQAPLILTKGDKSYAKFIQGSGVFSNEASLLYVYQDDNVKVWMVNVNGTTLELVEGENHNANTGTEFQPYAVSGNIELTANDINTYLGKQGIWDDIDFFASEDSYVKLTLDPKNTYANPLAGEFQAQGVTFTDDANGLVTPSSFALQANAYQSQTGTWVALKDKDENFIVVDTLNIAGTESFTTTLFDTAAKDKFYGTANTKTTQRLADSYLYRFTYNSTDGTINIESKAYLYKKDANYANTAATSATAAANAIINTKKYVRNEAGEISESTVADAVSLSYFNYTKLVNEVAYSWGQKSDLKLFLSADNLYKMTRIPTGVYKLKVVGSKYAYRIGKYWKASMGGGSNLLVDKQVRQNFYHMPAAQWVIESTVANNAKITNREFEDNSFEWNPAYRTTYGVAGKANQFFFLGGDTLEYIDVTADIKKINTLGYYQAEMGGYNLEKFSLNYLHELLMNQPVDLDEEVLKVKKSDKNGEFFRLEKVATMDFGYGAHLTGVAQLERTAYKIALYGAMSQDEKAYVYYDYADRKYRMTDPKKVEAWRASIFFLKENNEDKTEDGKVLEYYSLLEAMFYKGNYAYIESDTKANVVKSFIGGLPHNYPYYAKPGNILVIADKDGKAQVYETAAAATAAAGTNGTVYDIDGKFYARPELNDYYRYADSKVTVDYNTLVLTNDNLEDYGSAAVPNAAFTLTPDRSVLYRTLGLIEDEEVAIALEGAPKELDTYKVKFFRTLSTKPEFLYEDANSAYSSSENGGKGPNKPNKPVAEGGRENIKDQINFLGLEGKGDDIESSATMLARYVRGTVMPHYLILVDYKHNKGEEILCPVCEKAGKRDPNCIHDKIEPSYSTARALVTLTDSIGAYSKQTDKNKFIWGGKTRLAFVDVMFFNGDSAMYMVSDVEKIISDNKGKIELNASNELKGAEKFKKAVKFEKAKDLEGPHNNYMFSFRLIDEDYSVERPAEKNDFLIETEKATTGWGSTVAGLKNTWVKELNGAPVVDYTDFADIIKSQADRWNLSSSTDEATSNTGIADGTVKVVAGTGVVTIKGAAGKQVVVANILGQVVANTVLNADEETISVPAGVVVVSVDGEATKALVK